MIAAQRAMLERGEQKRKADWKQTEQAFEIADFMLKEREAAETAIATLDAYSYPTLPAAADILRNLLERLK